MIQLFQQHNFAFLGIKKPFRKNKNAHAGGIIVYVIEDIPSTELNSFNIDEDIKGMFIKINLRKSKWLVLATHKPPDHSREQYFDFIRISLDFYSEKYKNIILMGDFNITHTEEELQDFLEEQDLSNLVHFPTCSKSLDNPSTIDLIITNQKTIFQDTIGLSTGLSDFNKMVITSIETTFPKCPPKVKTYRDMKSFNKAALKKDLKAKLQNIEKTYSNLERLSQAYLINTHQKNRRLCVQIVSQMSLRL